MTRLLLFVVLFSGGCGASQQGPSSLAEKKVLAGTRTAVIAVCQESGLNMSREFRPPNERWLSNDLAIVSVQMPGSADRLHELTIGAIVGNEDAERRAIPVVATLALTSAGVSPLDSAEIQRIFIGIDRCKEAKRYEMAVGSAALTLEMVDENRLEITAKPL